MVRNILIVQREEAIEIIKQPLVPKMAMISITSYRRDIFVKGEAEKRLRRTGCRFILNLTFGDFSPEVKKRLPRKGCAPLFRKQHAKEIIAFLEYIRDEDIDLLLINCDAGISRSGAVGVFAHRLLGTSEQYFRRHNKYILPNPYVYDLLSKESGLKGKFVNFWERVEVHPQIAQMFK